MAVVSINYIEIKNGKPVIAGTRITAHDIAVMYVMNNSPVEWIAENYDITPAQIYAALSCYYDHKEQIDREIQEGDELAREVGTPLSEVIARMKARLKDLNAE
jgi:uncharacterized protein (DUF433 family)